MNEDKNQKSILEDNKSNSYNQKNNLFISRKTKIPEKDNQHTKKNIKFISIKKPYFQCTKNKKSHLILIFTMADRLKKKGIDLFKELLYLELIGKK